MADCPQCGMPVDEDLECPKCGACDSCCECFNDDDATEEGDEA